MTEHTETSDPTVAQVATDASLVGTRVEDFVDDRDDAECVRAVARIVNWLSLAPKYELGWATSPDNEPMLVVGGPAVSPGEAKLEQRADVDFEMVLRFTQNSKVISYYV